MDRSCHGMSLVCSDTKWNVTLHLEVDQLYIMAYSHCTGTGLGQVQGMGLGAMGPNILSPDRGKGIPGSIVSSCPQDLCGAG